ncbi:hypothetical protein Ciccas_013153 [Cichlidogyrus casuarinus]|uniref:Uncharacterized protein n=1 Tax=Cichlidogyrus casuarinus TaxID=1844966 RepID=A0ABD2PN59_9PLAT
MRANYLRMTPVDWFYFSSVPAARVHTEVNVNRPPRPLSAHELYCDPPSTSTASFSPAKNKYAKSSARSVLERQQQTTKIPYTSTSNGQKVTVFTQMKSGNQQPQMTTGARTVPIKVVKQSEQSKPFLVSSFASPPSTSGFYSHSRSSATLQHQHEQFFDSSISHHSFDDMAAQHTVSTVESSDCDSTICAGN